VEALDEALDTIEARGRELASLASGKSIDVKFRRFEPVQQVAARLELAGPERLVSSIHAGVDVRGDGSTEAYVGRVRREVVKQRAGETAYAALRRVVSARAGSAAR
jgi:hypothetical protein